MNREPDAYDAVLEHIFNETQGDALLHGDEDDVKTGVCLRVAQGLFRVFPDNEYLEPFENAIRQLNPEIAVKLRSTSISAALAKVKPGQQVLFIDAENRIQILPTMASVAFAEKGQGAAFVYDERMLVVWADQVEDIAIQVRQFESRLLSLVWRSRITPVAAAAPSAMALGMPGAKRENATPPVSKANEPFFEEAPTYDFKSSFPADFVAPAPDAQFVPLPDTAALDRRLSQIQPFARLDSDGSVFGSRRIEDLPPAPINLTLPQRRAALLPVVEDVPDVPVVARDFGRTQFVIVEEDEKEGVSTPSSESYPHEDKDGAIELSNLDSGKASLSNRDGLSSTGVAELNDEKIVASTADLHDEESQVPKRPLRYLAPIFNGLATAMSLLFVMIGIGKLVEEIVLDGYYPRLALVLCAPFLFCIALFFCITLITNVFFVFGPVAQFNENSKYYSAVAPKDVKMERLPHVTIQMPVYKESLEATITPSINSLQKAMITYARQGGTSSIFINDDGMQLISEELREERMRFYENRNIGWVARPGHGKDGYFRAGRFKKASNMNFGLALALRMEEILLELQNDPARKAELGIGASDDPFLDEEAELAERALELAVSETNGQAWARGGQALRIGEIILIVDSDTVVPEDCLRDAVREFAQSPELAIIQHESDVMQVAHHYFENGIAYFTRRINHAISVACSNGEVAPFVGHNAFLRWSAVQDAAFIDDADGVKKIWSESNVSEDFDMALRLQLKGYTIRWATYSNHGFQEGVSLTCDDELNRWQKYAYGCSELLFYPFKDWLRKGPITKQMRIFVWSPVPIHYKMSMMAYMFSYYGIAVSLPLTLLNYLLLGFSIPVDHFYNRGFELFLACTVVFVGLGNFGHSVLEYRLNRKGIIEALVGNFRWLPYFLFFFGGLSLSLSGALLAHLFSYNITWGATIKEVEDSNFFKEVPRIWKRFYGTFIVCGGIVAGMIVLSTPLMPRGYVIDKYSWATIVPLAIQVGCHLLFPIVLNPWLMIFSY